MTYSDFKFQFLKGIQSFFLAYDFVKTYKIWQGILQKKWIASILGFVVFFIAYHSYETLVSFINGTLEYDDEGANVQAGVFSGLSILTGELFFSSSIKYVILIALEVVTFHCSTRTLSILTQKDHSPSVNDFYNAEIRMIKVAVISWGLELICTIILSIIFSIIGFEVLKYPFIYLVQFFFVGLAFMDNYFEQYKYSIKASVRLIIEHAGASVAIGLLSLIMVFIPLIGPVVGPVLGAVSAAIYLFNADAGIMQEE